MPEALMSSTTSPGPGAGSGNSVSSSLRLPRKVTARMASSCLLLPRSEAQCALEPLGVQRPDLGVDDARNGLAVERIDELLGGDAAHVHARLMGDAGGVRARQHVVELEQRVIARRRLLAPHVEPGAGDALVAQRLEERRLVVDVAAAGGDEIG